MMQHLTERERETDERAEGADVQQADQPGVAVAQRGAHGASVNRHDVEVVHEPRRPDRGDD
jgi:hypothetical protein